METSINYTQGKYVDVLDDFDGKWRVGRIVRINDDSLSLQLDGMQRELEIVKFNLKITRFIQILRLMIKLVLR